MLLYIIGRIASFVFLRLSPRNSHVLAVMLGYLVYFTWRSGRNSLRENIRHVLGESATEEEVNKMTKESFFNYVQYLEDFIRLPAVEQEDIKQRVILKGWKNLDAALKDGKGAILVGLHAGGWDMMGAAIAQRNYSLNVVGKRNLSERLNEFVRKRRGQKGIKVVPTDSMENRLAEMVRVLKRNELLAMAIDITGADKSIAVNFFNAITHVPRGAATLALTTEAKVVPVTSVRLSNNRLIAFIGEHISFQPSGNYQEDIQTLTQRIMHPLEHYVSEHPNQWYMFKRMWHEERKEMPSPLDLLPPQTMESPL